MFWTGCPKRRAQVTPRLLSRVHLGSLRMRGNPWIPGNGPRAAPRIPRMRTGTSGRMHIIRGRVQLGPKHSQLRHTRWQQPRGVGVSQDSVWWPVLLYIVNCIWVNTIAFILYCDLSRSYVCNIIFIYNCCTIFLYTNVHTCQVYFDSQVFR